MLGRLLDSSGLGVTGREVGGGGNTSKVSNVRIGRLSRCLSGRLSRVGRRVQGGGCDPGPIGEMRVPGPSKNMHGLNMPAIMSEFIRRTVTRILAPVCRPGFDRSDCKFEPGEYYRVTVLGTLRFVGSNCR